METIGILYSNIDTGSPTIGRVSADLHINYLHLPKSGCSKRRKARRLLDFGLMIRGSYHQMNAIYLYFPFKFKETEVEDLGKVIEEKELLCTLFNGAFSATSIPGNSFIRVHDTRQQIQDFLIYELGEENFSVEEVGKGSLLKISINHLPNDVTNVIEPNGGASQNENVGETNLYIRFRVNIEGKPVYTKEEVPNDLLQSAFSVVEMTDFRINDFREIDVKTRELVWSGKRQFMFDKVHFFYVGTSNEEVGGGLSYSDCRPLNNTTWAKYYGHDESLNSRLIAYHWKLSGDSGRQIDEFTLFVKAVSQARNWKKIISYAIIVIVLGMIGSLFATIVINSLGLQ